MNGFPPKSGADTLPPAAIAALHAGHKIEAIRIVREERNIDLKAAKDLVEAYVRGQPSLQSAFAASRDERRGRVLGWLFVVVVLAVVAYQYLARA